MGEFPAQMNTLAIPHNLFGPDGLLIVLIVVLLFGAKKLPDLARGMGQAIKEFSKAKNEAPEPIEPERKGAPGKNEPSNVA